MPDFLSGIVINIDPATNACDILRTEGGVIYNVAIANTIGGPFTNDSSLLQNLRGSVVYYAYIENIPYVLGTLPQPIKIESGISTGSAKATVGGDSPGTYGYTANSDYTHGRSVEASPNDKVISTDGGASLHLLNEGGVILKASSLAQLILGAGMDFARLVAREFQIFTDFGEMCFHHGSSGRTGLTIKGGASYGEEAASDGGINTVFMQLGDTESMPDARFGVRVTSTDGVNFGAVVIGKDGKVRITSSLDTHINVGNELQLLSGGDSYFEIGMNHGIKVFRNRRLQVGKDDDTYVAKDRSVTVGGNQEIATCGQHTLQVQGTLTIGCSGLIIQNFGATESNGMEIQCKSLDIKKV